MTTTKQAQFRTSIDLNANTREQVVELCNQQLADMLDLYTQTKQAHWNVKGMQFYQLHKLFDKAAEVVLGHIDTVAERATSLGGMALGTARMAAGSTRLPEFNTDEVDGRGVVSQMVERFSNVAASTRQAIDTADDYGDKSTADLFTEVSRDLDQQLWFIEAHLQDQHE